MEKDLSILLVEDIPSDADLIEHELSRAGIECKICRVETEPDFLFSLTGFCPDIILSKFYLPTLNGLKALALAREHSPQTPFIMVTEAINEETAVDCMKAGAWDYVLKDRITRLIPAILTAQEKKHTLDERNQELEALKKSRSFYLRLLETSPALIWRTDSQGNFTYFNQKWLEFISYSADQDLAKVLMESLHQEDKNQFLEDFRIAHTAASLFESECRLRNQSGEYRRIQTFGRPLSDEMGIYSGHIGYCFDTTERFETEEVLRKLSRAVEQSTSSFLITDTEGCIEYANASFTRMTGYTLSEVIGANANPIEKTDTAPDIFGNSWEIIQTEGKWCGERLSRKRDGDSYWELATISPIIDTDDVTTHYLVELEDITRRKEAEQELQKNRAKLIQSHEELNALFNQVETSKREWERTLDCIGDIVILITADGKIKRCNKALQEFTSLTYQEIIGSHWKDFLTHHGLNFPPELPPGCEIHHESSGRCFYCTSYPFADNDQNEISGFVLTIHDFTKRKAVSDELERAYGKLKATQAKIVQQEKMASIGQLAAGVAHEINNPMGFISSNLGTMRKYLGRLAEHVAFISNAIDSLPDDEFRQGLREQRKTLKIDYLIEDGKELIDESLEGAERVRSIVQNLKSFSRVDESECKPVDINDCLESTIKIVWNEVKYKATLVRDLETLPLIRCYPQQLNQVFMNLLVNASQAIEKKGEIRVRTWHEGESVYASVSDTGCGIPDGVLNRIFEPFFTTKEVGKGTGLGLSITYDIIKKHKGEIFVESRPGAGTTFTIRLPVQ
ncbi:MAG: PAS domain S-box protein [Geobacteraceae bacterium]|nr:PAS domain S-box protein [Geobacteraceae bacterium]